MTNITSGDCPPSAVGNPPTFDLEIALRSADASGAAHPRTTPDHLAVIRPPTAPRLTARRRLRADRLPRSGLRARWGESTAAFSADGGFAESNPLTPLVDGRAWNAGARHFNRRPSRVSPFPPEHVNAPAFPSSRCLPPEKTCANALSSAREERCHRWPAGTVAARVHRRSRTSTRPLSARYSRASSRPRAPLRLLQVNVSTSTTRDRSNIPNRGVAVGTTAMLDRRSPFDPATAEGAQGQGSRTPSLDTPHRDCSRQRLCPNPDRFGHLLSRVPPSSRSGVTWGEDDAANAASACKAHAARGSCDGRFPRRDRTFTNPRGLPSLAVRDANGEASFRTASCSATAPSAFFTTKNPREGRSHGSRWLDL